MLRLRSFLKSNRGQSLVEMAIILPVLLMLIFGMVEFGRILSSYLIMENLSRDAARYGVVGHTDTEILNLVSAQNPGLDTTILDVDINPGGNRTRGTALTITLNYSVNIIAPIMSDLLPNPFPLETSCTMMVE